MSKTDKHWFFYGGPFSQWYFASFTIAGVTYCHCEQWMMAEKARLFGDDAALKAILAESDPRVIKGYGRQVKGFVKEIWEKIESNGKPFCWNAVYQGNYAKFSQNPGLKKFLLDETGDRLLVEASPSDAIWGIKMSDGTPGIEDPKNWRGTNWLGEAITQVREDMRKEIAATN